jgi:DNA-directed RNA polymerase specialized sigma24 family protein
VAHHRLTKRRPLTLLDKDPDVAVYNDPIARMALQKAQERLSPAAMVAFTLGAVNGLDHNEMALVMDVTPDCARARLSRACRELRATLS